MTLTSQKALKDIDSIPTVATKSGSAKSGAGGLRDELKRFTRERLIKAALDSFAADGFRATSVERIVELAGTTAPTFYRHFSSKNDLLIPLKERLQEEIRAIVHGLDLLEAIDFRSIRQWLDDYVQMWLRVHKLCVAYWEATELDEAYAADVIPSSLETICALTSFLDRFDEQDRASIKLRLALIIPMLDRSIRASHGLRDNGLKEQMLDELTNMIVLALRHPGPVD